MQFSSCPWPQILHLAALTNISFTPSYPIYLLIELQFVLRRGDLTRRPYVAGLKKQPKKTSQIPLLHISPQGRRDEGIVQSLYERCCTLKQCWVAFFTHLLCSCGFWESWGTFVTRAMCCGDPWERKVASSSYTNNNPILNNNYCTVIATC